MIIFCEECGERYVIENEDIKGPEVVFVCRGCKDIIRVPAPDVYNKPVEPVKSSAEKQ